jgi:hypothetical protein
MLEACRMAFPWNGARWLLVVPTTTIDSLATDSRANDMQRTEDGDSSANFDGCDPGARRSRSRLERLERGQQRAAMPLHPTIAPLGACPTEIFRLLRSRRAPAHYP